MTTKQAQTIVFPPFRLDAANQQLWRGEEVLALRPKPFAVLAYLLERPGQLVTKEELLDACWPDTEMTYTVLKVSIREIRGALGDDPKAPRFIETMHRRGYRFIGQIAEERGEQQQVRTSGRLVAPLRLRLSTATKGLVGREAELARLRGALERALGGERQVVFVSGEAGIGKTSLVEAFLLKAAADPRIWLAQGQCLEQFGSSDAYLPALEAISRLCQEPGRERFVALLRRHAPTWLLQMPWLAPKGELEALRRETLGGTRERMLREIAEAIEALTAETPLVLVFEDLHWSDYSTLDLISRLARRRERARLLVIGAYRSVEAALQEHPLGSVKQELQVKRLCEELSLEYLSEAAVGEYLTRRFPQSEFPEALARLIHERTRGNPLFMVNAVDYLQASGLITELDGRWELHVALADLEVGVPESIRQMIEKQLERLSQQEQRALEAASVAGVEFDAAAVAAGLEKEAMGIEEVCEGLARRHQFLQAVGVSELPDGRVTARYSFMHSLYQNILYQQVGEARRVRLHLLMGEQGERVYGEQAGERAAELAMHFEQGRDYRRAIRYLRQAAENDLRRYANREAVNYLTRALELIERLPEAERVALRLPALEQLGVARHSMGETRQAVEDFAALAECARELGQVAGEARALFYLASSQLWLDRARCLEAAGRAFDLCLHLPGAPATTQARGDCGYWHALLRGWRSEDARICAEALSAARGAGERSLLTSLVGRQAYFQCLQSEYRVACDTAREGRQLAAEAGNAYEYLFCLYYQAWSLLHLGQWGEAHGVVWDGIRMAQKNGHEIWGSLFQLVLAWLHEQGCDFGRARELCEQSLRQLQQTSYKYGQLLAHTLLGIAHLGLEQYEPAFLCFSEVIRGMEREGIRDWLLQMPLHQGLSQYWLAQRDFAQARAQAETLCAMAAGPGERTYLAQGRRLLAEIAMAARDWTRAETEVSQALATIDETEAPLAQWRVHATAARLYEQLGRKADAARCRMKSAAALRRLADSLGEAGELRQSLLTHPRIQLIGAKC